MDPTPETATGAPWRRRLWPWILGTALVPILVALVQLGRLHPDEVYQALEPAYHRARGYGILAWEWQRGLRNWAIPGLFSGLLRLTDALGIDHPRLYRAVLALPQLALHVWSLWAVHRYVARRAPTGAATVPAILAVGLYGPVVAFAGRTLSESFSAALLLVAVDALDREERPRWAGLLGGAALGLSVVARYGSGVVVLAALAWLVFRRRWAQLYYAVFAGAAVAAALGALDWATWGRPFHSLREYLDFNVLSGAAAKQFGAAPAWYYLPRLPLHAPAWALLALPFALRRPGLRLSLPLFCAIAYFVVLSLTAHKEERFLYPGLVLLTLAAAPGLLYGLELLPKGKARLAALTAALVAGFLPFFIQGVPGGPRGDQFRAIVKATRPNEVTGLLIVGEGIWGAGGYFYIGKRIPWTVADWPRDHNYRAAMARPEFNRVVTYDERALDDLQRRGWRVVDRIGRATILVR